MSEYLVRGATLVCSNGSHKRKINLPKCHGVYVGHHPLLHELEHKEEWRCGKENCNITSFGVCIPKEGNPPPTEIKTLDRRAENSKNGAAGPVTGHICRPEIVGKWHQAYEKTRIVDNGLNNVSDRARVKNNTGTPVGQSTLTMDSFLVCAYGGRIAPVDSGQRRNVMINEFIDPSEYNEVMGQPGPYANQLERINENK
ncbi:MAG: DUF4280 domain-containing protein [Lachnospiraceae bacterium]|nr:DUF4280 domain-containing protein [Lachnospiraceae bacterium]